jgi:hypothetical protein
MNTNKQRLNNEKMCFISLTNREEQEKVTASVFEIEIADTLNMETISLSATAINTCHITRCHKKKQVLSTIVLMLDVITS